MRYFLLNDEDGLIPIEKLEFQGDDRFTISGEIPLPAKGFTVVDENLDIYVCRLNFQSLVGLVIGQVTASEARLNAIATEMRRLQMVIESKAERRTN